MFKPKTLLSFRFLIFNGSYEGSGRPAWQIKWAA
jgi:hypothetical protein